MDILRLQALPSIQNTAYLYTVKLMKENSYLTQTGTDVQRATTLLKEGRVVAVPTETVYGLAANALNSEAVAAIFEAKDRPFFDPLIVHIKDMQQLQSLVADFPEDARNLMQRFWPGPLTLVLPKTELVPDLVTSGLPHVAVRMPAHPLMCELLSMLDFPLAAPSANMFGRISPTTPHHVLSQLNGRIPYILDGGACAVGVESTIVAFGTAGVKVLREGGVSREELSAWVKIDDTTTATDNSHQPVAPGMLSSHYAPAKPVMFISDSEQLPQKPFVLISMGNDVLSPHAAMYINLSEDSNLQEAAANFFNALHKADEAEAMQIVIRKFPEIGLGRALNDRANRAAANR